MNPRDDTDPFGERRRRAYRRTLRVLGADVQFTSDDRNLLGLASRAFGGLPRHRWRAGTPRLVITLSLAARSERAPRVPPAPRFSAGGGQLFANVDEANFAVVDPERHRAFVQVSQDRLECEYEVRYELIEFAALTLATRAQALVPLHAACVSLGDRGLLVIGDSGAGKSTLVLASLDEGLEILSEDSVFFSPADGRVSGVPNYLYLRGDTARFAPPGFREALREAPVIARRSGVRKHQWDLRGGRARLAAQPVELVATLVLGNERVRDDRLLSGIGAREAVRVLRATQRYAARQPGWSDFERTLAAQRAYRLSRGRDPARAARVARSLLEAP